MLYSVRGKVSVCEPSLVVVETGGVGFMLHTSLRAQSAVKTGDDVLFYTYLHVREDMMDLYGFPSREELACFKQLISVSGVGPRVALAILGACSPSQLVLSVVAGDEKALCQAPGVGKKLAQRIILDLKDKMAKSAFEDDALAPALEVASGDTFADAVSALMVLGYSRAQAQTALKGASADMSVDDMVRAALKRLF